MRNGGKVLYKFFFISGMAWVEAGCQADLESHSVLHSMEHMGRAWNSKFPQIPCLGRKSPNYLSKVHRQVYLSFLPCQKFSSR